MAGTVHVTVRPAVTGDLAEVQRLNAALFAYEDSLDLHEHSRNLDWPYSGAGTAYFQKCLAGEEGNAAFIAELAGAPVGYLAAALYERTWMATNPIAEISNMYVEEAYRRQGVGGALMKAFKTWAQHHRAQRLKVGALSGNHPALAFYRLHGFRDVETFLEQ